ncbi:hypothetical protein Asi03nite_59750 [Actinoplanes siamensis]|uniref:Uncharacterized protein n=1 Tax=Actinoplanes siamensis TaxID=1223317 RepID=A0A919TN76_9ACTN|nr:hypothetical protein Asi03nite_59750 [Actinoplanes siamensis]
MPQRQPPGELPGGDRDVVAVAQQQRHFPQFSHGAYRSLEIVETFASTSWHAFGASVERWRQVRAAARDQAGGAQGGLDVDAA